MKRLTLPFLLLLFILGRSSAQSPSAIHVLRNVTKRLESFNGSPSTLNSTKTTSEPANVTTITQSGCVGNLVTNGDFESPRLAKGAFTQRRSIMGWSRSGSGLIEIQNHAAGVPQSGNQWMELDSDKSSTVTQTLNTIPGKTYILSFYFAARPRSKIEQNVLLIKWNGAEVARLTKAGSQGTNWEKHQYEVVATKTTTILSFADAGISNSIGTYVDDVCVVCKDAEVSTKTPSTERGELKTTAKESPTTSQEKSTSTLEKPITVQESSNTTSHTSSNSLETIKSVLEKMQSKMEPLPGSQSGDNNSGGSSQSIPKDTNTTSSEVKSVEQATLKKTTTNDKQSTQSGLKKVEKKN